MFYIVAFICSIWNIFMCRKFYILLALGLFIYFANIFIKVGLSIDVDTYMIKFRYLIYTIFLLNFSLEGENTK